MNPNCACTCGKSGRSLTYLVVTGWHSKFGVVSLGFCFGAVAAAQEFLSFPCEGFRTWRRALKSRICFRTLLVTLLVRWDSILVEFGTNI